MATPSDLGGARQQAEATFAPSQYVANASHEPLSHRPDASMTVYQTTGPDARTTPILAADNITPALNPRSCATCRRRKVRCDKQMPCSNCRRGQIPCVFPAPGRAPRRPKDPNAPSRSGSHREAELVRRLRKLEGIVEELSEQVEVESAGRDVSIVNSPDGTVTPRTSISAHRHSSAGLFTRNISSASSSRPPDTPSDHSSEGGTRKEAHHKFGRLFRNEPSGPARYVSSAFWSKLNDELDAIREETQKLTDNDSDFSESDENSNDSPNGSSVQDHHAFVFGYRSADVNLQQCHPMPSQIPFLWTVYKENVDPFVKVAHVPSVDILLREARKDLNSLSPGSEALLFSIYFGAVVSLEPQEVKSNLGEDKETLYSRFRFAVEQALARANFLRNPDMETIQALTIFLTTVRREEDSRFCWSLLALLVRAAQGLGFHRDGSLLNLSPFETEMRRRVWWSIIMLDARSAEELGTDVLIGEKSYDAEIPSNINDSDIEPGSTSIPEPREGRSDTAVSALRFEICSWIRRLFLSGNELTFSYPDPPDANSVAEREAMLIQVFERVENKFLKHLAKETDSLYYASVMIARIILGKMCLILYQPLLFSGSDERLSDHVRQRAFVASIDIIEYSCKLNMDPRFKQFYWLLRTYLNWNAIVFTLLETSRRPWTALTERGWEALVGYRKSPQDVVGHGGNNDAFVPLRRLYLRAKQHRASEIARLRANPEEARKLDFDERTNSIMSRFGPVPGPEGEMERVRARWRRLLWPDGSAPGALGTLAGHSGSHEAAVLASPIAGARSELVQTPGQLYQPQAPTATSQAIAADFRNAAMDFVDNFMANPSIVSLASLWPISDAAVDTSSSTGIPAEHLATAGYGYQQVGNDGNAMIADTTTVQGDGGGDRQQQQQHASLPDDELPPYLVAQPVGPLDMKIDNLNGDFDMIVDDFDWQTWSQSIRDLEMGNTQQFRPF